MGLLCSLPGKRGHCPTAQLWLQLAGAGGSRARALQPAAWPAVRPSQPLLSIHPRAAKQAKHRQGGGASLACASRVCGQVGAVGAGPTAGQVGGRPPPQRRNHSPRSPNTTEQQGH